MGITLQFVDAPSTSANVRYDFNIKTPSLQTLPLGGDGLDLGNPGYTGEPGSIGAIYGYRSMRLTQRIIAPSKAGALTQMSRLSKELLREDNWLRFQSDPTMSPVWFKTYRTEPGTMSMEWSETAGAWDVTVPLVADPFAYGARQTLSTFQVIQGPTDLTGPTRTAMRVVLPTIKGDAPTALRVTLSPAAGIAGTTAQQWMVGCVAGSASMTDTIIDIGTGDTVTNVSGTAAPTTDATYFGGSYRTVTIGAATPNLLTRFTLSSPTTIAVGRYKVLMRCRYTAGAVQTLLFRLQQYRNGSSLDVAKSSTFADVDMIATDTGRSFWVDLGEFSFPSSINPPADAGGTMPTLAKLAVDIGTGSGAASSINVDAIKLIPIYGATVTRTTLLKATGSGLSQVASSAYYGTFDGDLETFWGKLSSSSEYNEIAARLEGGFPVADPGAAQNLLIVMAMDSGQGSASGSTYVTNLNGQTAVDVSYYPRYLYVGDGS